MPGILCKVQFLVVPNGSHGVQGSLSLLKLISVAPVAVIVNVTSVEDVYASPLLMVMETLVGP